MKLYAIRDRLLAYFQRPLVGDSDYQVKASLAAVINDEVNTNAISKAPHHFELWTLAEIDEETGNVRPNPEFLCDCSSLIRDGVRPSTTGGDPPVDQAARSRQGAPGRITGATRANGAAPQAGPPGAHTAPGTPAGGNPGSTRLADIDKG